MNCCGIYMRNGTGGEPGLHLTVSCLSNPIWSNGVGMAVARRQQQGTALWRMEGRYDFETPNHAGVTAFAPPASARCDDMRRGAGRHHGDKGIELQ